MKKALIVYWLHPTSPPTVREQLHDLTSIDDIAFDYLNICFGVGKIESFLKKFRYRLLRNRLDQYDLIIFHNTASYNPFILEKSFELFSDSMIECRAKKVLFKQDEMIHVNATKTLIKNYGINTVFTCIPTSEIEKVYPKKEFGHVQFQTVLTGYLRKEFAMRKNKPYESRSRDITYRGMATPFEWGRLAHEKFLIGEEFLRRSSEKRIDLKLDISSDPKARFSGSDWYDFLEDSKVSLAVESGASIFDFDGTVKLKCDAYRKNHPGASFQEVEEKILKPFEGNVLYNQISPRHLEAAALETGLIMFEGNYSGILKPGVNFIALKKDFSNFEEVIYEFRDTLHVKGIIQNNKKLVIERSDLHSDHYLKIVSLRLLES